MKYLGRTLLALAIIGQIVLMVVRHRQIKTLRELEAHGVSTSSVTFSTDPPIGFALAGDSWTCTLQSDGTWKSSDSKHTPEDCLIAYWKQSIKRPVDVAPPEKICVGESAEYMGNCPHMGYLEQN